MPETSPSPYESLETSFGYLHTLFALRQMLHFDFAAHMPPGAMQAHLKAIAVLNGHIYTGATDDKLALLFTRARGQILADAWQQENLRQMKRLYDHHAAVPRDLYRQHIEIKMLHRTRYAEARKSGDWQEALPYLRHVLDLYREIGALKAKRLGLPTPYSALIAGYADGLTEEDIDALFARLVPELQTLRDQALARQNPDEPEHPTYATPERAAMLRASRNILSRMGFDFERGELFVSRSGPMATGVWEDTRVLIRCPEANPDLEDVLTDTLYQGASALYVQGVPERWKDQPAGQVQDVLLVNAVSLLFETIIGRSLAFFHFVARPDHGGEPAESIYRRRNRVRPSATRNGADEIHKIFHDLVRFRIERDLFSGALALEDVPERWDAECEALTGVRPSSASEGPIQNPDWFSGRYGFIGTSPVSQILAARLFAAILSDRPGLMEEIARGEFSAIGAWLKDKLFRHARSRSWQELGVLGPGKGMLDATAFLAHVRRRYCEGIY